jgi:HEAT repeat protein
MTDEIEIRKQIAAEAQIGPGADASPAVRAFQFFLVPLVIVALCALGWWGVSLMIANPRSAEEWLLDVEQGGPNVRPHAALQLAQAIRRMQVPDARLTPRLIQLYRGTRAEEQELRKYLLNCLANLKDPRASEVFLEVARKASEPAELRGAAFDGLGAVKDPATLPDLAKMLDDPDPLVRKYAAFNAAAVAERAGDRSVVGPLRAMLKDPVADVGWNAAFALAYFLGDGSGTDTLKKMLDRNALEASIPPSDPNRALLAARAMVSACNAAAKLKDASFVPLLKRLVDPAHERDGDVRYIAAQAIHKIEERR